MHDAKWLILYFRLEFKFKFNLVEKSDQYMKQMQENNRRYYEQQLDKELDDMEKDLKSGNIIGAMYHRNAAYTYLRLLNLM